MPSFFTILSIASIALAESQHIIDKPLSPHPVTWNGTCIDGEGLSLLTLKHPFCPKSEDHTSEPATEPDSPSSSSWTVERTSSSSPWTLEPECIKTFDEQHLFCVYTSATFANGRGISIVTKPDIAEHLAQSPAFTHPEILRDFNLEVNAPFTVQPIPGRGLGVIMNRTVHRGDTLFSYTPVIIIHREVFSLFQKEDIHFYEKHAVECLPARARELFLALHGHFGDDKIDDIIHTNSFQVDLGPDEHKEAHNAVFPETSRMNHDCRPNAHYYFDVNTLTHHTHAIRTINTGEELSISYIDATRPRAERQQLTMTSWGFACSCSLCTQRDIFARESDRRLQLIEELEEGLDDWSDESLATPDMAETLISLYEQERLHAPIALAYTQAALAYNAVGKAHSAMKYASLALEANIVNSGPDFSDVAAVREILENPEGHWSWKIRV